MSAPRVSVVMPVFNGEPFLEEAIKSVLDQEYGDFELIIVDDGSFDGSVRTARGFSDSRIRLVMRGENTGLARVRNVGLSAARGEYLAWLDSDDVALPCRLSSQVRFLDEHPAAVMVCGNVDHIDAHSRVVESAVYRDSAVPLPWELLWANPVAQSTVVLRLRAIREAGLEYRDQYPPAEDYDLWCRLSGLGELGRLPEVVTRYRIRPNSAYHTNQERALRVSIDSSVEMATSLAGSKAPSFHRYLTDFSAHLGEHPPFLDAPEVVRWLDTLRGGFHERAKCSAADARSIAGDCENRLGKLLSRLHPAPAFVSALRVARRWPALSLQVASHAYLGALRRGVRGLRKSARGSGFLAKASMARTGELLDFRKRDGVLIVGQTDSFGGAKTYLQNLVRYFKQAGVRPITALQAPRGAERMKAAVGADVAIEIDDRAADPWSAVRCLKRRLGSYRPRVVIVSAATPGWGVPYLMLGDESYYVVHTAPTGPLEREACWLLSRLRSRVVAVSKHARKELVKATGGCIAEAAVAVVPNGASVRRGETRDNACAASPQGPTVLTIGHVADHKNPLFWTDVALRVLAELPEVRFVWVGDGPLLDYCRVLTRAEPRILFAGGIDGADDLCSTATVYYQPSLRESQGIAVLEAMGWGLPCVVSNRGGLPESVIDGQTGFVVDVVKPGESVEALVALLRDPDVRQRMGSSGLARFAEAYSFDCWSRRIDSLLGRTTG